MKETILVKAELEFEVELDGTRTIREVVEDFTLDFSNPTGSLITVTKNNFTVYDGEVDDEDLY
jgi:hypothetical protein